MWLNVHGEPEYPEEGVPCDSLQETDRPAASASTAKPPAEDVQAAHKRTATAETINADGPGASGASAANEEDGSRAQGGLVHDYRLVYAALAAHEQAMLTPAPSPAKCQPVDPWAEVHLFQIEEVVTGTADAEASGPPAPLGGC